MTKNHLFALSLGLLATFCFAPQASAGDDDAAEAGEDVPAGRDGDADPLKSAKVVKQVFDDAREACGKLRNTRDAMSIVTCVKSVNLKELTAALKNMRNSWNDSIAKNGRLTLGPRSVEYNTDQTGALFGKAQRRFIGLEPITSNAVDVVITKRRGKAAGKAEACLSDESGKIECKSVAFDDGRKSQTQSIRLEGAAGKVLVVRVQGDGAATRKFGYGLRVTQP